MIATAKYFTEKELCCKHCGQCEVTQALCDALDAFRETVNKPVLVDDAYRCPEHNKAVGGVPNSQHVLGTAADIRVEGLSATDLYHVALEVPAIHGIGRDDHENYLHVDVREHPAKWCYAVNGQQEPWYDPQDIS